MSVVTINLPDELCPAQQADFPHPVVDLSGGVRAVVHQAVATVRLTMDTPSEKNLTMVAVIEHEDGKLIVRHDTYNSSGMRTKSEVVSRADALRAIEQLLNIVRFGAGLGPEPIAVK